VLLATTSVNDNRLRTAGAESATLEFQLQFSQTQTASLSLFGQRTFSLAVVSLPVERERFKLRHPKFLQQWISGLFKSLMLSLTVES